MSDGEAFPREDSATWAVEELLLAIVGQDRLTRTEWAKVSGCDPRLIRTSELPKFASFIGGFEFAVTWLASAGGLTVLRDTSDDGKEATYQVLPKTTVIRV